jgi:hypothetical protein
VVPLAALLGQRVSDGREDCPTGHASNSSIVFRSLALLMWARSMNCDARARFLFREPARVTRGVNIRAIVADEEDHKRVIALATAAAVGANSGRRRP